MLHVDPVNECNESFGCAAGCCRVRPSGSDGDEGDDGSIGVTMTCGRTVRLTVVTLDVSPAVSLTSYVKESFRLPLRSKFASVSAVLSVKVMLPSALTATVPSDGGVTTVTEAGSRG